MFTYRPDPDIHPRPLPHPAFPSPSRPSAYTTYHDRRCSHETDHTLGTDTDRQRSQSPPAPAAGKRVHPPPPPLSLHHHASDTSITTHTTPRRLDHITFTDTAPLSASAKTKHLPHDPSRDLPPLSALLSPARTPVTASFTKQHPPPLPRVPAERIYDENPVKLPLSATLTEGFGRQRISHPPKPPIAGSSPRASSATAIIASLRPLTTSSKLVIHPPLATAHLERSIHYPRTPATAPVSRVIDPLSVQGVSTPTRTTCVHPPPLPTPHLSRRSDPPSAVHTHLPSADSETDTLPLLTATSTLSAARSTPPLTTPRTPHIAHTTPDADKMATMADMTGSASASYGSFGLAISLSKPPAPAVHTGKASLDPLSASNLDTVPTPSSTISPVNFNIAPAPVTTNTTASNDPITTANTKAPIPADADADGDDEDAPSDPTFDAIDVPASRPSTASATPLGNPSPIPRSLTSSVEDPHVEQHEGIQHGQDIIMSDNESGEDKFMAAQRRTRAAEKAGKDKERENGRDKGEKEVGRKRKEERDEEEM